MDDLVGMYFTSNEFTEVPVCLRNDDQKLQSGEPFASSGDHNLTNAALQHAGNQSPLFKTFQTTHACRPRITRSLTQEFVVQSSISLARAMSRITSGHTMRADRHYRNEVDVMQLPPSARQNDTGTPGPAKPTSLCGSRASALGVHSLDNARIGMEATCSSDPTVSSNQQNNRSRPDTYALRA
jgi:hypothetical protein